MIAVCKKCVEKDVRLVVKGRHLGDYGTLYSMRESANWFKRNKNGAICASYCGIYYKNEQDYMTFSSHRGYEQFLKKPLIKAKLREQL